MSQDATEPSHDETEEERQTRLLIAEVSRRNQEALKHENWNCKVGDLLEVMVDMTFHEWPDEHTDDPVAIHMKAEGQVYRVADLKGRGFDLERVSGDGPDEIRAMNSEIPGRYRVLPPP